MAVEVKVPDLGEGIEATISRWLVQEGDTVQEGDVLLELATDKVDTEVPAPASGTVLQILRREGELVSPGDVLLLLGEAGEEVSASPTPAGKPTSEPSPEPSPEPAPEKAPTPQPQKTAPAQKPVKATPVARRMAQEQGVPLEAIQGTGPGGQVTKADVARYLAQRAQPSPSGPSPLPDEFADVASLPVRRAAADFNVDLRQVAGDRPLSTLTRHDVLAYAAREKGLDHLPTAPRYPGPEETSPPPAQERPPAPAAQAPGQAPPPPPLEEEDVLVPHTRMRLLVARNVTRSAFTAPHVTTMWDVDMRAVLAHRKAHKAEFARRGVKLTLTAYLIKALVAGVRAVPAANAIWTEEGVIIKGRVHVGMAVALPPDEYGLGGLIVPVIRNADELSLEGIARRVNDLAQRARAGQLKPEELQGGTITLTNYGTSGSRFQTPILVQPQVAILGVGVVEKRPIVVSQGRPLEANTGDYLTFAPMSTLGLSYDHRVLDGATADAFCRAVKEALESWAVDEE